MASKTICTNAQNELLSKSEGHNQAQVECGSSFSYYCECHKESDQEVDKEVVSITARRFHRGKPMEDNINDRCNIKKHKSDNLSENIGQKASLQLRVVNNANDNSDLDGMHRTCDASNSDQLQELVRPPKNNTLQDLYMQGQYDDENDDDDSDWEPVSHFVMKKWFCANCTMANFDDVNHCEVCGEDRDSGLFEFDLSQSRLENDVHHAIDSGTVHINQGSSSKMKTAIGFDERMLLHAEVEMKSHPHPERPDRLRAIASSFVSAGIFRGNCSLIQAREITEEELLTVHSLDHIQEVQLTSNLLSSYFTSDTYANEHSACAARLAAGLCADLARAIVDGSAKNGFALVRPPGHHAGVKHAMGFCLHNNAAVAALAAQAAGAKKVLIVDWDVHHGNGTQEIFDENKSVLYISLHRHENGRFYPGTGAVNDIGNLNGKGYSVNIPWSRGGVGDNDYIYAFQHVVLPIASEFAPDITIISAGFDAARGDPLGCCDITPAGYAQMTHMLTNLSEGKLLVILEGGYNLRSISSSAVAVVKVLLGEIPNSEPAKVAPPSKAGVQTILEVLKVQHMYWPSLTPGYMELLAEWGLVASNKKQKKKKRKRHVGPLWWKWGSKRFVYELIYRRHQHKGYLTL